MQYKDMQKCHQLLVRRLVQKEALRKLRYVHAWRTECGQNHKVKAYNKSFQNASQFTYLGTTCTMKLGADRGQGMPATVRSGIFRYPVCYLQRQTDYNFAGCVTLARDILESY